MNLLFDIPREVLKAELRKINNLIPVKITDVFNTQRTIWLQKETANGFWGVDLYNNTYKIFPSTSINILSIGHRIVQSKESYREEKEIYIEFKKQKKNQLYRQAYHHSKQLI